MVIQKDPREFEKKMLWNLHTLLNIFGLSVIRQDRFSKMRTALTAFIVLHSSTGVIAELIANFHGFETISRFSEPFFVIFQTGWKVSHLITLKRFFETLIHKLDKFWPVAKFDEKYQEEIMSPLHISRRFFLIYAYSTFLACMYYIMAPVILKSGEMPFMTYGETKMTGTVYNVMYLWQGIEILSSLMLPAYDGILLYLIASVCTELRMTRVAFKKSMSSVEDGSFKPTFKEAAQHHIFVLSITQEINNIFSMTILNQYATCLGGICIGMFVLYMTDPPIPISFIVKYICYCGVLILQMGMYCLMGHQLTHEHSIIADGLFYRDWLKKQTYFDKTSIVLVIKMVQKRRSLSIGGFSALTLQTLISLLQQAWSFFTVLQVMYDK